MSADTALPAPPPKLDPETLAIRARPRRAIRFKRGVIVAIAAFGSVSLVAVTWVALRPTVFSHVITQEAQSQPNVRPNPDTLSGLPANYGEVPQLGPPLPGDLGKPIFERQQQLADQTGTDDVQQAAQAKQERRATELKSARESGVLVQNHQATDTPMSAPTTMAAPATMADTTKLPIDTEHDPNAQGQKAEFVGALNPRGDVNPHRLTPLSSPYTLSAGSVIAASLITGLRSDLPGLVTAQVTQSVYDSATGRILLIPQGARLIGKYDSVVAFGQKRALVVWQRIILPDGSSIDLDNMPASDPSGYAGLQDKVDFHTWQLLKGAAVSTLLGVGSDLQFSGNGGLVEAIRQSGTQNVSRAGDQLTAKALDIQPTLTIRPGTPVRLLVEKDLILAPWRTGVMP